MSIQTLVRAINQPLHPFPFREVSIEEAAARYNGGINRLIYVIYGILYGEEAANTKFPQIQEKAMSVTDLSDKLSDLLQPHNVNRNIQAVIFTFENQKYILRELEEGVGFELLQIAKNEVCLIVKNKTIKDLAKKV